MSFSAQWLALREPYDQAARNETVLDAVRKAFAGHAAVRVCDLGCGTGSTMRAVAPLLPARQDWRLLDNDAALLEAGISQATAAAFAASERAALAAVRHVIVTSPSTQRVLVADYGVADAVVTVAMPGNDRIAMEARSRGDGVALLAVGSVVPRKGYDVLVDALAAIADLDWRLVVAGDRTRDRTTADAIEAQIAARALSARVRMLGAVGEEALDALHREADLFVLASRHEGYGMAFTAAISHGLPVVGTRAGAIPETVAPGAGILVTPDDVAGLAAALRVMIADPCARETHAAAARAAAVQLPDWDTTARVFLRVLTALA